MEQNRTFITFHIQSFKDWKALVIYLLTAGGVIYIVQYVMTDCQNERRRFLNKENDKKRYDVCVDRYVTVGFETSGTMEKAHRKHPHLNCG